MVAKARLKLPTTRNGFSSTSAYRSSSLQGSAGKPAMHESFWVLFDWILHPSFTIWRALFERHSKHRFYSASISSLLFYLTPSFRSSTSLGMVLFTSSPRSTMGKREKVLKQMRLKLESAPGHTASEWKGQIWMPDPPLTPGPRSFSRTIPCSLPYRPGSKKYPRAL